MRMRNAIFPAVAMLAACGPREDPVESGATLYASYCSACHGVVGEGDGPVAGVMRINVPNLRSLAQRANGTFPREAVSAYIDGRNLPSAHGDRRMPVWGNVFRWSEDDAAEAEMRAMRNIEAIVDFVLELQY